MKSKRYYVEKYNKRWSKCFDEASESGSEDSGYDATILFDETANAEEIVGYYLVHHAENPLKDWLNNIKGINLSEQDKEVTAILKSFQTNSYKECKRELKL